MTHTYHAKGRSWTVDERDVVLVYSRFERRTLVLGYNHSRAWSSALNA